MEEDGRGWQRLNQATRAALDTASQSGRLQGSVRTALEATLARLDKKISTESDNTDLSFNVEAMPGHCLVVAHSSDPVAIDVVSSFMHHAGATKPGTAKAWLLPLDEVPVTRWARALRRVLAAERRNQGDMSGAALPIKLTFTWARKDELVMASIG